MSRPLPTPPPAVAGDRVAAFIHTTPAVLYLIVLVALPMAVVAAYSLLVSSSDGGVTVRLTIDNYRRAFDPLFLAVLGHSSWLALMTTAVALCVGYPCALGLRSLGPKQRAAALALIIIPSWMNLLVKNYAWITILRREGVLNTLLLRAGVIAEPLPLLFNDGAVMVGLVHTYLPFMILPLYAAVDRMDWSLVEAARDLGAGRWRTFRDVVLPQTRAGALAGTILVFIPTLGAFVTPDLLGGPRSIMIANLIENQVLQVRDWPFAAALSMFLIALVLLSLFLVRRVSRDTGGALP